MLLLLLLYPDFQIKIEINLNIIFIKNVVFHIWKNNTNWLIILNTLKSYFSFKLKNPKIILYYIM